MDDIERLRRIIKNGGRIVVSKNDYNDIKNKVIPRINCREYLGVSLEGLKVYADKIGSVRDGELVAFGEGGDMMIININKAK